MRIPPSLQREHEELHADLARAERQPGRIGEAARRVARIMHPHFLREDEYAIPPLGLLPRLARGEVSADMSVALPLVARLKEELPLMLQEHKAILGALRELSEAAEAESNDGFVRLAGDLMVHAQMEEEVLYPAAVLVGEYVSMRLRERVAAKGDVCA
jgi:hemerythrin HHE cation binding domain-containing protein